MKNKISPKRLQCNIGNPLAPTVAILHLPEMELSLDTCERQGNSYCVKASQNINVEINHHSESTVSSFEGKSFELIAPSAPNDDLTLELESTTLGLNFKVGLDPKGKVKSVTADWAWAS